MLVLENSVVLWGADGALEWNGLSFVRAQQLIG